MPQWLNDATKIINYICTIVFCLEAILKIVSENYKDYFRDNWNKFDFGICVVTLISLIIDTSVHFNTGRRASIIRSFRVARILRMFKRAKVLRMIIDTLIITLPSFANMGGLLMLILFIYAVLGV